MIYDARFTGAGIVGCEIGIMRIPDTGKESIMSFGVVGAPKTKKALKELVAERGADGVQVFDTSMFNNRGTIKLSDLGTADEIVGPDVYVSRKWYANFRGGKIV